MSRLTTAIVAVLALLVLGGIEFLSGTEVRLLALYFFPLLFASWRLGRVGAVLVASIACAVSVGVPLAQGVQYANPLAWLVNVGTEGAAFFTVAYLVGKMRELVERERLLGRFDALTGLANRRTFVERATSELDRSRRHGRPVCLAFIDLDNFKRVNDTHGHHRGDEVLKACARLIAGNVRSSDIVARLGGDEFVVLLPETDADSAQALLERMRHAIERSPDIISVGVTPSIGLVFENPITSDIEALLRKADGLMYEAKREGKNTVRSRTDLVRRTPVAAPVAPPAATPAAAPPRADDTVDETL
ncbi:MAG: GGDEF domain-containing protein [Burkholderiaceae bacterium]|nr:GGDEF domain-containing protein [Burkholderiaceae bacterium]